MSMLAGVGASAACKEILIEIEKLAIQARDNTGALLVLTVLKEKIEAIKAAADSGWYP